jgi:hypothetical protein
MNEMTDKDLDQLLQQATKPGLPAGFEQRMRAQIAAPDKAADIIQFRPRAVVIAPRKSSWLVGVPLAASLLLGVVLGAQGTASTMFMDETETAFTSEDFTTGFEEAEEAAEEDAT